MMDEGVLVQRERVFAAQRDEALGLDLAVLLVGGAWSYVAVDDPPESLADIVSLLDGSDTSAIPELGERLGFPAIEMLVELLVDQGAFAIRPYDQRPSSLAVLEAVVLNLIFRAFVAVFPRRAIGFIVAHLDSKANPLEPPGWRGDREEEIVAALHSAASFPLCTTRCVPVSLTTYWLLRRRRARPTFRLAVSIEPFEAHVWVTSNERDVDPRSEAFAGVSMRCLC